MSDTLTLTERLLRMAGMEISAGDTERASFTAWLEALPEREKLAFFSDVAEYAELLGLSMEKAGRKSADPMQQLRQDGLYHYLLALRRLYQIHGLDSDSGGNS